MSTSQSSLSSVVSNLVRAQMGSSVSNSVMDEDLDRHVAELILKEAKQKAERYGKDGIRAYLQSGQSDSNVPKANKRFLSSIIRNTDDHNKTILRAQAVAAQEIRMEREEQERRERRARAEEAVAAERLRRRTGKSGRTDWAHNWDRGEGRDSKRRDRSRERRNDYAEESDSERDRRSERRERERHHRHRSRSGERRSRKVDERHSGHSRGRAQTDDDHEERRSHRRRRDRIRSPTPPRDRSRERDDERHRKRRRRHSREGLKGRRSSRSLGRHSHSPPPTLASGQGTRPSSLIADHDRMDKDTSLDIRSPRSDIEEAGGAFSREDELRLLLKRKGKARAEDDSGTPATRETSPRLPSAEGDSTNNRKASPSHGNACDVQSASSHTYRSSVSPSRSPPPPMSSPPPLPPPSVPSKMDKYFESSYDPRLDVTPLTIPEIPATGLINDAEFAGWDAMLEIIRLRREDKAEKKVLERWGIGTDKSKDKKTKKGDHTAGNSWSEGGTDIMNIEYKKRGSVREWDLGKEGF